MTPSIESAIIGIRRRLTLPGRFQPSTISAKRLNFCVRYGNRWIPLAIATGNLIYFLYRSLKTAQSPLWNLDLGPAASFTFLHLQ